MRYKKEIDTILRDIFYEEWMSEEDFQDTKNIINNVLGISEQKLSDDLHKGVENGYSVEYQIKIIKKVLLNE